MTGWPTVRKHPRTLSDAFPDVRATWHEGWQRPINDRWAGRLLAVAIGVALTVTVMYGG